MIERRHFEHTTRFKDRMIWFAKEARERAAQLAPSPAKSDLLQKARQADVAASFDDWANSPEAAK